MFKNNIFRHNIILYRNKFRKDRDKTNFNEQNFCTQHTIGQEQV